MHWIFCHHFATGNDCTKKKITKVSQLYTQIVYTLWCLCRSVLPVRRYMCCHCFLEYLRPYFYVFLGTIASTLVYFRLERPSAVKKQLSRRHSTVVIQVCLWVIELCPSYMDFSSLVWFLLFTFFSLGSRISFVMCVWFRYCSWFWHLWRTWCCLALVLCGWKKSVMTTPSKSYRPSCVPSVTSPVSYSMLSTIGQLLNLYVFSVS